MPHSLTPGEPSIDLIRLRQTQATAWADLFATAEGVGSGLRVKRRPFGDGDIAMFEGIGHPFQSAYHNQAFLLVDLEELDSEVFETWLAAVDSFGVPYSICAPEENAGTSARAGRAGLIPGPALALWTTVPRKGSMAVGGLAVDRVSAEQANDFAATLPSSTPAGVVELHRALVGRPGWDHYVGYVDGVPASGAILYSDGEVGYLGWAHTRPEYRGRGLQRALIEARLDRGAELELDRLITKIIAPTTDPQRATEQPNPSSRNARRCGFEVVGFDRIWVPAAHAEAIFASAAAS